MAVLAVFLFLSTENCIDLRNYLEQMVFLKKDLSDEA